MISLFDIVFTVVVVVAASLAPMLGAPTSSVLSALIGVFAVRSYYCGRYAKAYDEAELRAIRAESRL